MAKASQSKLRAENEELRLRLEEAEQALEAIRTGQVESLVVEGPDGPRIFSLEGATQSYRLLVESMNEGAVSLALDGTILYSNSAFARMIDTPLDHVMGHKLAEFVAPEDIALLGDLAPGLGCEQLGKTPILQIAAGQRAEPRAGDTKRKTAGLIAGQHEDVAEQLAHGIGIDVAAVRCTRFAASLVPIGKELLVRRMFHT